MSQPYPPPHPGQGSPRPGGPDQTHPGSWTPQGPPETYPSLPHQPRSPYDQSPYHQQPYHQQPYHAQPAHPGGGPYGGHPPQAPRPGNGTGVTALVLALVGLMLSWIPFVGILSVLLGLAAIVFGMVGRNQARQGRATPTLPVVGAAIGIVAVVIGIVGTALAVRAVGDAIGNAGARPGSSASAPLPAAPPPAGTDIVPAPGAHAWEDGLSVEVSAPRAVTFSGTACCPADGAPGVAFEVRVVNNTAEVVEPFGLLATLTADGRDAAQVFDTANDFDGVTSAIPPGRDLTVTMAFEAAGGDLLLEISSFDRDSAFFAATR